MIGKSLAHYTIQSHLGTGGMGEVWRAKDGKLGRDVALKLLPSAFARDPERLARFQREAQLLASLNHPGIAAIYGLEQVDQSQVLVLELVEGPTLADRLADGPIPVAEALPIALQMAEAIEAAHEKGIVHRDLKPANVKLTPDGRVKVLDFGLAKALVDDPASAASRSSAHGDLRDSPTVSPAIGALTSPAITGAMTAAHVILGTAAYMSPEQARGQVVDRRADIWAFGVILYEMLTGRRLFTGETISDTLAAVLKTDPDWTALPADTPPRVRRLLRRCLEKNPKDRLRDAGDARLLLREAIAGAPEETASMMSAAPVAAPRRSWLIPAIAIAAAVVMSASALLNLRPRAGAPPALRKFVIPIEKGGRLEFLAFSPDGAALAAVHDGKIEVRELTTGEIRTFPGTDGAVALFWSPDGQWLAYGASDGNLEKVRRTGGESTVVATLRKEQRVDTVGGGAWGTDDRITFASGSGGIYVVSAQGGEAQLVASPKGGETDFHEAIALPNGRGFLMVVHGPKGFDSITALDVKGGRHDVITLPEQSLYDISWSPSGHVLFRRAGTAEGVWAFPFSAKDRKRTGEPFLVSSNATHVTAAGDGSIAYIRGSVSRRSTLAFVDRTGKVVRKIGDPGEYRHFPALSPDHRQIACPMTDGETHNVWVVDAERGSRRRLTFETEQQLWPYWSPDGREIWYSNGDAMRGMIRAVAASGATPPRDVTVGLAPVLAADGRMFYTRMKDSAYDLDIWTLAPGGEAKPESLIASGDGEFVAVPSPTDPLIAYTSDASGENQLYLATSPRITATWLVSSRGGQWPRWRSDGREVYYATGDSIFATTIQPGKGDVRLGTPQLLFRRPQHRSTYGGIADGFDITPDGQLFLINLSEEETAEPPALVIVQNWFEEFRKKKS